MQTVILAGGLGTRLWPITRVVPKPMVPVAGVPYLEHQLRLLREQSLTDVVLLTGYLGEQIEDYFGDGSRLGLSIRYSKEDAPLGTGGALKRAQHLLAESFLVIYGDSYLPIDYGQVARRLQESMALAAVVVYDNLHEDTSVKNNIAVDDRCFVSRYDKDSGDAGLQYVEAGVLALSRAVLDWIPASGVVSLEKEVFPKLIANRQLAAHLTRQRFYDIGTLDRLKVIEQLFAL